MPTISESPLELREWKFERVRQQFLNGLIGEATFSASLFCLGLRGQDLRAELNLALMEKANARRKDRS